MKLVIGNDHAATELKFQIMAYLEQKGVEVINVGTDTNESFDYAIAAFKAGKLVASGEVDGGVLICGTGVGISMAANKVRGIRAAACSDPVTARLTKQHNNANIICFGARVVSTELANDIVDTFLTTPFSNGERHKRRIAQIHAIEE